MNLDDINQDPQIPTPVPTPTQAPTPVGTPEVPPTPTIPIPEVPPTPPVTPPPPQAEININVANDSIGKPNDKRSNGFFRILSLLALTVVGFLMLGESTGILAINIQGFDLHIVYPIAVLLSVIILFLYKRFIGKLLGFILFLVIIGGLTTISIYHSLIPGGPSKFNEPLQFALPQGDNVQINITSSISNYMIAGKVLSHPEFSGTSNHLIIDGSYQSDRSLLASTGFVKNIPYLTLQESPKWNIIQDISSNVVMYLSDDTDFTLYIKNFIGKYLLDFSQVARKLITLHGGIGDININIGDQFDNNAELNIRSARSKINLQIPKDVGVRLYYKQLAGSIELQNFQKIADKKNYYESSNIVNAKKIVNISVQVGVGKFKSTWIE